MKKSSEKAEQIERKIVGHIKAWKDNNETQKESIGRQFN